MCEGGGVKIKSPNFFSDYVTFNKRHTHVHRDINIIFFNLSRWTSVHTWVIVIIVVNKRRWGIWSVDRAGTLQKGRGTSSSGCCASDVSGGISSPVVVRACIVYTHRFVSVVYNINYMICVYTDRLSLLLIIIRKAHTDTYARII